MNNSRPDGFDGFVKLASAKRFVDGIHLNNVLFSRRSWLSPSGRSTVAEKTMMNRLEMVPSNLEQILNLTMDCEKSLGPGFQNPDRDCEPGRSY